MNLTPNLLVTGIILGALGILLIVCIIGFLSRKNDRQCSCGRKWGVKRICKILRIAPTMPTAEAFARYRYSKIDRFTRFLKKDHTRTRLPLVVLMTRVSAFAPDKAMPDAQATRRFRYATKLWNHYVSIACSWFLPIWHRIIRINSVKYETFIFAKCVKRCSTVRYVKGEDRRFTFIEIWWRKMFHAGEFELDLELFRLAGIPLDSKAVLEAAKQFERMAASRGRRPASLSRAASSRSVWLKQHLGMSMPTA